MGWPDVSAIGGPFERHTHLYHSELLKELGVYIFKADRDKPTLRKNKVEIFKHHLAVMRLSQSETNIYLHNLMAFMQEANIQHYNKYLLSFIVEISHNLKASKMTLTKNYLNQLTPFYYHLQK